MPKNCICGKRASFGIEDRKPSHCKTCKTDVMKDVVSKRCSCGNRPSFGTTGNLPTHCKKCKADDMEDVRSKRCQCGQFVSFGLIDGKPTHCGKCKTVDMINVRANKCKCGSIASFGLINGKPTHCGRCKTGDMKNVKNKMCQCGKRASFGLVNGKPTHCGKCKVDDMEDVRSKRCPGYNGVPCPTKYFTGSNQYCLACDPDDSRRHNKKRDETAFFNFLYNSGVKVTQQDYPVHYRCIDTNKTMARIDGIIVTKDVITCLELDEDAHETYDKGCEEARMHNVSAELKLAFPDHIIAWVRVNPHSKENGQRDVSARALKIRDQRHQEALRVIEDILHKPRDCIEYIGY